MTLVVVGMATTGIVPRAFAAEIADPAPFPRAELMDRALDAYRRVEDAGRLHRQLLTVVDYSLPSWERRLWVIDPNKLEVLYHEFVAHGRGSAPDENPDWAVAFGNQAESRRSSLGAFLTGGTYVGRHGESLELLGLDAGVNDNALARRIVIHPADYVSAAFRATWGGRVGRSFGCPALDPAVAAALIACIRDGSLVYVGGGTPAQIATAVAAAP
jgi:hypothetical protein